jgi:hypothetical protein
MKIAAKGVMNPEGFDSYEEYDEHRNVLDGLVKQGRVERIFDGYKWKENIPKY